MLKILLIQTDRNILTGKTADNMILNNIERFIIEFKVVKQVAISHLQNSIKLIFGKSTFLNDIFVDQNSYGKLYLC